MLVLDAMQMTLHAINFHSFFTEKEKFLRELELNKKNFGADDRLPQLTQALDEQKALNAKLQEQITNERAKFNSKNNIAIERYTNLEQKHLVC